MPDRTPRHAVRFALLAACLAGAMPLAAQQRASLADRVAALERQAAAPQGNVELLNQITVLKGEIQSLRAQIEELQRLQRQQDDKARSQYLDLDGRLVRLEGGTPGSPVPAATGEPSDSGPADAPPPASLSGPPAGAPDEGEQADYLAAFEELKRGDYVASAGAFEDFLARHPRGTYAPNALYWLGESYYVTQNYELAEQQFRAVLERFPTHDKAPGALLKAGLSQFGQGAVEAAAATLAEVVERYPGTDVARTAEDSLRSMRLNDL